MSYLCIYWSRWSLQPNTSNRNTTTFKKYWEFLIKRRLILYCSKLLVYHSLWPNIQVCKNFHKIVPLDFALVFYPHNHNIHYMDRNFLKTKFWGPHWKLIIDILQSQHFLYSKESIKLSQSNGVTATFLAALVGTNSNIVKNRTNLLQELQRVCKYCNT